MEPQAHEHSWWRHGAIYQIYPRSYQDSNGDGVGDLQGIRQRLDHLKRLGIKAIWLSPIYPSPMADFGYDISNYVDIDPVFGTLEDFDALLTDAHSAGLKLILDFVPNHTSNLHPWFLESRSSRDNPKRNWYLWHDARPDGGPPNNWLAHFGGKAWEWNEATGQYYYHAFLKEQPDLNWRNHEVQEAMLGVMRFWLDRGVDGFRVDVMHHVIKDAQWRDNPVNPDFQPHMNDYDQLLPAYSADQPEVLDIVRKMRKVLDAYNDRMMVGELYLPIHRLVTYYGTDDDKGVHLPFNFQLISLPWHAPSLAAAIDSYEGALPEHGWPNWVLGNHDQPRITSRVGPEQAKVAAMLLLTLRGTPTLYYGDEIGMRDVPIPRNEVRDPQGINMPEKNLSRDPARTPMQWDNGPNAGFTQGAPWLRLDRNHARINVATQLEDPFSILNLHHRLLRLRAREPALHSGSYAPFHSDTQCLAYLRVAEGSRFLVALNLTHRPCYLDAGNLRGTIEASTFPGHEDEPLGGSISLAGDEGLVIRLAPEEAA
jgi:alpha-glucosidase